MDYTFHLQQGQQLIEKKDANSMKKALEHFVSANKMIEETDIGRPKVLYFLALGNYLIGNIDKSYMIAYKAKRSIDIAIENSMITMNNMRQMIGENDIDMLIKHLEDKFSHIIMHVPNDDDDFDENEMDFTNVNKLYETKDEKVIKANYTIDDLSKDVIMATFSGMNRTNDELVYFDKSKGNVLMYVQGYFSPMTGDQSISNRILANRITSGEPNDFVDETKHVLIDRLLLSDFLNEFTSIANGKEPFASFEEIFTREILKDYSGYDEHITINDLTFTNHTQEKFHNVFSEKYQDRIYELKNDYVKIFETACENIAKNWIRNKILK